MDIVKELRARAYQGRFNLEAANTIESLQQQLESYKIDAERYRWLRDQHWVESEAVFRLSLTEDDDQRKYHAAINQAIDAAMSKP